ncbi:hypothetical protein ABZP36_007778 [Zizania latifolia]
MLCTAPPDPTLPDDTPHSPGIALSSLEEIRFFAQKRNLVPILFDTEVLDIAWLFDDKLEATVLQSKLGRRNIGKKECQGIEVLPFSRNKHFDGREKELSEIEGMFFWCADDVEVLERPRGAMTNGESSGVSDGFPVIEASSGKGRSIQKQRSKHKKSRFQCNSKDHGNP